MTNTTTQAVNPFKEVRSIEIWWFDECKDWIVQYMDADGVQIGEASYCPFKFAAIEEAKRFKAEYYRAYNLRYSHENRIRIFAVKNKTNQYYKEIVNLTPYKNQYSGKTYTL